jgi:hypothetical protein
MKSDEEEDEEEIVIAITTIPLRWADLAPRISVVRQREAVTRPDIPDFDGEEHD